MDVMEWQNLQHYNKANGEMSVLEGVVATWIVHFVMQIWIFAQWQSTTKQRFS